MFFEGLLRLILGQHNLELYRVQKVGISVTGVFTWLVKSLPYFLHSLMSIFVLVLMLHEESLLNFIVYPEILKI